MNVSECHLDGLVHHYRIDGTLAQAIDQVRQDVYEEALYLGLPVTWDDIFEFRYDNSVYILANPIVGPNRRRNFDLQVREDGYYLDADAPCLYPQLVRRIDIAGPPTVVADFVPNILAYDPWAGASSKRGER